VLVQVLVLALAQMQVQLLAAPPPAAQQEPVLAQAPLLALHSARLQHLP
jgi:hypothetical protein